MHEPVCTPEEALAYPTEAARECPAVARPVAQAQHLYVTACCLAAVRLACLMLQPHEVQNPLKGHTWMHCHQHSDYLAGMVLLQLGAGWP